MASGEDRSTVRPLRPATPPDGPLASTGAAPEPTSVPRPRRAVPDAPPPAGDAGQPMADSGKSAAEGAGEPAAGTEPTPTANPTATDRTSDPGTAKSDASGEAGPADGDTKGDSPEALGRRRRMPFAHAVPLSPPRQAVLGAARATRAWSRRPSGRLTVPGVFLIGLVAATAAVGAVVVPAAVRTPSPVAVDATASTGIGAPSGDPTAAPAVPGAPVVPGATGLPGLLPGGVAPTGPAAAPATGRPADALAGWARATGAEVGVSPVAMQAYGYAELVLAQTNRSCQLSWTTLAAIGYVESRHGQANGATLHPDGRAEPEIIGDPLDGQGGRSRITDTDRGLFDRDTVYDRAIGPMQFIPTTWQQIGADADNDGRKDPHDLDDAALAAGRYLCAGGRNMTIAGDWWGAILSYNDVRRYAQDVFDTANRYGQASRT
ncbi:lytic murein transglycosylase [Micromonospora sp. DT47]|uniref:lytic transglycosylase domain-containing protein n=1 Tax=Micromonospora sp. DT47 TaxID=3393431 RepID=UPI003CF2134F